MPDETKVKTMKPESVMEKEAGPERSTRKKKGGDASMRRKKDDKVETVKPTAAMEKKEEDEKEKSKKGDKPPAKANNSVRKKKDPKEKGAETAKPEAPVEDKGTRLENRAGEPEFQLGINPEVVNFVCADDKKPVLCEIKIKNTSKERQSFKVKCTSADIFSVQPPLGFVKADETAVVKIWYINKTPIGDNPKHYFAMFHQKAGDAKTVKEVWAKSSKPEGVRRLKATFEKKE